MKKTLRGAALAIAENFSQDIEHVRDCEYQPGHWRTRLYTPFSDGKYYTATSGKMPPSPKSLSTRTEHDSWHDAKWVEVTQEWFANKYNNRIFVLVSSDNT